MVDWETIHHGNITAQGRRALQSQTGSPTSVTTCLSDSSERTIVSERTFQREWGKSSLLTIEKENAKEAYLFTTCCDREYFNKVSNGEVRNFLGFYRANNSQYLETYRLP